MARFLVLIAGHFSSLLSLARSIELAILLNFWLAGVKWLGRAKFPDVDTCPHLKSSW